MARSRNRSVFGASQHQGLRLVPVVAVVLALVAGGLLYLGFADLAPEGAPVVREIPNERFGL